MAAFLSKLPHLFPWRRSGPPQSVSNNPNNVKANPSANTNNRISKIAIPILKGVAAVALGALFTAMSMSGFGVTVIIISTIVGGVGAGIIYTTAYLVMMAVQRYGFPLYPHRKQGPIELENWLTDENREKIPSIIEPWVQEVWFKNWLKIHQKSIGKGPEEIKDVSNLLWKKLRKGAFYGESAALIEKSLNSPKLVNEFFGKLKADKVFFWQFLNIIRADLIHFNKDTSTLDSKFPAVELEKDLFLNDLETFTQFQNAFTDDLSTKNKKYIGVIALQTATTVHTLFVQFTPEFVIYDGLGKKFNGYHAQFSDYPAGMQSLYAHLKGYHSRWRPFAPKFQQANFKIYSSDLPPAAPVAANPPQNNLPANPDPMQPDPVNPPSPISPAPNNGVVNPQQNNLSANPDPIELPEEN